MNIQPVEPLIHSQLPGVQVFPLSGKMEEGQDQQVLVVMEPNAEIPLHCHDYQASMFVVAGDADVLSDQGIVGKAMRGTKVFFEALKNHGFRAGREGMSFVSSNGGIVDFNEGKWNMRFA